MLLTSAFLAIFNDMYKIFYEFRRNFVTHLSNCQRIYDHFFVIVLVSFSFNRAVFVTSESDQFFCTVFMFLMLIMFNFVNL
jgi:hypothetical protein